MNLRKLMLYETKPLPVNEDRLQLRDRHGNPQDSLIGYGGYGLAAQALTYAKKAFGQ
jgi:hypothetical protein